MRMTGLGLGFGLAAAVFALVACQPAPAPAPAAKTVEPAPAAAPAAVVTTYVVDPAVADNDAEFRGPMTLADEENGALLLTFMDGKHVVTLRPSGKAEGTARIDGPLRLHAALGAPETAEIALYEVGDEQGPVGDPDYTPLCGVRTATHVAVYRTEGKIALATSSGLFGAPDARGCSNTIAYITKPPAP